MSPLVALALIPIISAGPQRQTVHGGATPSSLRYLLYLPTGYQKGGEERFPLVLQLHGARQVGNQIDLVMASGLAEVIEQGMDYPFIAVSPQCPTVAGWQPSALEALLNDLEKEYRVDPARIYAVGFSMGGRGVWDLASRLPTRFAAIMPICNGSQFANPKRLASTPAWAFHGDKDDVVPLATTERLVDAVRAAGGDVKFTVLPGQGHLIWDDIYKAEEPFKWLLSHRRPPLAP